MADVIAYLKADVSNYDAGLAKATKGLKNFVAQNTTVNGIMAQGMTTLTKFASGFAAAQMAVKAFNAVIMEGSQATGDFVRNNLGALNDTLGVLSTSLSTLDFSILSNGLSDVYERALRTREVLDSLGDTLRGLGIAGDAAREAVNALREVNSNANSSQSDIASATERAQKAVNDYTETIKTTIDETNAWVSAQVNLKGGMTSITTTADDVEELMVSYAKMGMTAKAAFEEEAEAAAAGRAEIQARLDALSGQPSVTTSPMATGLVNVGVSVGKKGTADEIKKVKAELEEYEAVNDRLLRANSIFRNNNDEELDMMAQNIRNIAQYQIQAETMQRRLNTAMNTKPASSGGGVSAPTQTEAQSYEFMKMSPIDLSRSIDNVAVPSMNKLIALAKSFREELLSATTGDQYVNASKGLEAVEKQMAAQPLALQAGLSLDDAVIQQQLDELGENLRLDMKANVEVNTQSMEKAAKSGKESEKSWDAAARALASAGSALQSIDNKGLNVAGTIMEAIANVALGFASALKSPATTAPGVFGWIAAAAAGTATMIATIAAIKSQTKGSYAQGGIVPGSYNGGMDNTYVYASPGEVILNRSQQENLLSQLGDEGGGSVSVALKGEQLAVVLNNYGRRRGKGELLFG